MTRTSLRKPLAAAVLLVLLAGCAGKRKPYTDTNMDFGSIQSVAVMPFTNLSRDNLAHDRVRDVFANVLIATGAFYVLPQGEVLRGIGKAAVVTPMTPSAEDVVKLGQVLKVDAVVTGVVREYGEVRSGNAAANVVSVSVQLQEVLTGKTIWSGSTTRGGVKFKERLLGGGGAPLNDVTEEAVDDLIEKLFQ